MVTQTFGYSTGTTTFVVPAGITLLSLQLDGGEGGRGGNDVAGPSPVGGYQGVVSGTIAVNPGDVLTIAVGQGGTTGPSQVTGSSTNFTAGAPAGGANPLGGYKGGNGGVAGWQGNSGDAGGGGAATVVTTGSTTIIAGGAGGAGGSGQFQPTIGRVPYSTFAARTDTTTTAGQDGLSVGQVCNSATGSCDGGGGGAGGGGAVGGAQGDVQFGSGSSDEWYGYGGYPGENSTGGIGGLSASYQYYPDDSANGSVVISYSTGAPGAPTAVSGVAGDTTVALSWTPPTAAGQSAISDYVVEYALASSPTSWTTFADGVSTATSTIVTGLSDDTAYVFQVSAVNTAGQGTASASSDAVTPIGVPTSPTITSVTAQDGALSLAFTAPVSGSAPTTYEYQLNGIGSWITALTTNSPLQISGLTNGTLYSVQIRANSVVGEGAASPAGSGTPEAPAGAPSISSTLTGVGTAIVAFTPGYSGGVTISDYEYELNDSGTWTSAMSATSPLTITGLANATTYAIAIRAVTTSGSGAASADASVTTPGTPAAPVVGTIASGDTTLSIPFTAGATGGSTITSYEYQTVTSGPWTAASSSASPFVVTGLTNGATYQVSVRAINAVGTGAASTPQTATPATVPGPPVIVGNTVAGSNHQLSAAFTAPASNGGATIIGYDYSTDAGATWRTAGTTTSPVVISVLSLDGTTPLVNGATYYVELRAINAIGIGTASAVATGIAQTAPSAPGIASVTPGPSSLTLVITPASNGGAAITSYQYQVGSSGWVDTGTLGTTFVIGSLTNGTSYGVTVRAINTQGSSSASGSTAGTPRTTPAQPTISSVARGDRSLTIAVSEASNGGSAITNWQYSTDSGSTWSTAAQTVSPLIITALSTDGVTAIANGASYPVAVRAVNAAGASAPSGTTGVGPSTTPVAPVVVLVAANQAIQVTFTVADNGGSPISAIEYAINTGAWVDAGTLSSPFVIGALTNGTAYSIKVRADNTIGVGTGSIPASATPFTVPDPPTSISAVSDTGSADVSWTPPTNTGGSPITTYVADAFATPSSSVPFATCATSTTSCTIGSLSDSIVYYVSVFAQNAAGGSTASTPVVAVTPLARPGAPTLNSLTSGNSFLSLNFSAGTNGDALVTAYQYQLNGGSWLPASSTTSPLTITGVINGTSYQVVLRGVSSAGVGVASTALTATPYTFPDAPDSSTAVAAGVAGVAGAIAVTWLAPNNNGSPITSYTATAFNAATDGTQITTCTTATLTCTLGGLSDNTTYWVSLQSTNTAGFSSRSARLSVATSLLPGAVSTVIGTSGDGLVALSWTAGGDGASPVNDYAVWYSSGGSYTQFADGVSSATSATVTGLTNGTAYTFEVYAVNNGGTGPVSAASAPVTPAALPDSPTIGVATAVNQSATVVWTPPVNNGGDPISGYIIVPSIGSAITVGNVTSYALVGLTNGTAYTFRVAAITAAGTGLQSAPSNSVTPNPTAPGLPTIVSAAAGNARVALVWTAPADNGGSAVTGYVITPSSGSPVTVGNVTSYTVTGLTNSIGYAFVVAAINTVGTGGNSAPSGSVTPSPTVPAAPTLAMGTAGNATIALVWTAPADNGGSAVTGYLITPSSGSPVTVGNVTAHTFAGLINGNGYTFTVAAINTIGTGAPSVSSTLAIPSPTAPGAAVIGVATAANTSATLVWTAPIDNGGSLVTGYVITPSSGAPVTVGNVTTYTMTGLTNGTAYTFTVAAINVVATGANSSASNSVTPHPTAPGAPTLVAASAGNTTATLTWIAPIDDGGSAIIGYTITPSIGSPITVGDVTTYTLTGLLNGTGYTFTVAAINQLGTGATSFVASNAVTPAAGGSATVNPTAPTQIFGADRFGTAVATSVVEFPTNGSAGAVVLARSDDYPDALVGIRLAAAKNAPLLFATGGTLTTATQAELIRVLPAGGTVYLLGGEAAIPESVATTLTGLGYVVQRFAGTDRFGTALAVAAALGNPGTVLLATGINFPDALAAGPAAAHIDGVVLLTDGSVLPASVRAYLSAHPGVVYAVGGPAVAADPSAIALTGADRYATAVAVAALFSGPTKLGVASGTTFADALSGGAFLAHVDGPLLLTAPTTLPSSTTGYLDTVKSSVLTSTLFGGPMAVGQTVVSAVGAALGAT
jgi:titin